MGSCSFPPTHICKTNKLFLTTLQTIKCIVVSEKFFLVSTKWSPLCSDSTQKALILKMCELILSIYNTEQVFFFFFLCSRIHTHALISRKKVSLPIIRSCNIRDGININKRILTLPNRNKAPILFKVASTVLLRRSVPTDSAIMVRTLPDSFFFFYLMIKQWLLFICVKVRYLQVPFDFGK